MNPGDSVPPETVFAALKPEALGTLAEEAHRRRRHADLAAILDPAVRAPRRRRRWPLSPGIAQAAAAAAAVAVVASAVAVLHPSGHRTDRTTPRSSASPAALSPSGVLQAAAASAERQPAATPGRYWYQSVRTVQEADWFAVKGEKRVSGVDARGDVRLHSTFTIASTEDIWEPGSGIGRARAVSGLDTSVTFTDPADRATWLQAGSPSSGLPLKPHTSEIDVAANRRRSALTLTPAELSALPASADALRADLYGRWQQDRASGLSNDDFTLTLWSDSESWLAGPLSPGTRAALYRLLADLPGISSVGVEQDPLGRNGIALQLRSSCMIIDPGTGRLLAYTAGGTDHGHQSALTTSYLTAGWVNAIGEHAGE